MAQEKTELEIELNSGKYLFKFCKFDTNALQIIINKTLYFSAPDKLNDPLDSKFDLKIKNPNNFSNVTKEIIKESTTNLNEEINWLFRHDNSELDSDIISQEKLFKEYFNYIQGTVTGVCCFSQTHSDNLLWAHYADRAKGLCFVFDKEKLHESFHKNLKGSDYRIIHDHITYRGVKRLEIRLHRNGEFGYSNYHLFSKTSHWKYEKEYRFVLKKYRKTLFSISPNRYNPFLKYDNECLKFIIIGPRMPEEHSYMLEQLKASKFTNAEILGQTFD